MILKNRNILIIIILFLLAGGFFYFLYPYSKKGNNYINKSDMGGAPSEIAQPVASVPGPEEAPEPPEDLSPEEKRVVEKERQFRKGIAEQANRPLGFYGKVVDQAGQPVPGVQIQARIAYHQGVWVPELKQEVFYVRTDAMGRFAITNQKGTNLYIEKLQKKGYISEVGPTSFKDHYLADQEKASPEPPYNQAPVIFKIWKKQEPAEIVKGGDHGGVWPNKPFHSLEIPRTDGALQIKFKKEPSDEKEWAVYLRVKKGGLKPTKKIYMFKAPNEGYKRTWKFRMTSEKGSPEGSVNQKFFLKAKSGEIYGRLEMTFWGAGRKYNGKDIAAVSWDYAINPHGSRNLLGKYD